MLTRPVQNVLDDGPRSSCCQLFQILVDPRVVRLGNDPLRKDSFSLTSANLNSVCALELPLGMHLP